MNRQKTSKICINVEFLAGTNIEDAIAEAKELALELNVAYIHFNFNVKKLSISGHANVERALRRYRENSKFVVE